MAPSDSTAPVTGNLRIVSACTMLSRVLGLVRDIALAARFGNGPILDAFTVAFRIPNLARALLGEGALTTAFLPAFIGELHREGPHAAARLASAVFVTQSALLVGLAMVGEAVLWMLGAWFPLSPESELLRTLTAILLPYVIFICLAAQLNAVLHALGRFFWPAMVPVVLNLAWLFSLWWIVPLWDDPVRQMAVMCACVVAAGGLQLLFPVPLLARLGYRLRSDARHAWPQVREILQQMLPVLLGLSVTQFNTVVDSFIAWGFSRPEHGPAMISWWPGVAYPLDAGTASALYLGQRLYQFPLGVFGVALGTVLFPVFAAHAQRNDDDALRADFAMGLRLVAAIGVPSSAGLVIIAGPLASVCFERGQFDAADAAQTAQMIAAYGCAVWAYCGLLIAQRAFYATGDRITPLQIGVYAALGNLALNLALMWPLGGVGIAMATAIVSSLQCVATSWRFVQKLDGIDWRPVLISFAKTLAATAVMALVATALLRTLDGAAVWSRLVPVASALAGGLAAYFATAAIIGLHEPWDLLRRRPHTPHPIRNAVDAVATAESLDPPA